MDLNTITEVVRRPSERPGTDWHEGDAWLAGGTWLYSVEQPDLSRLIDLISLCSFLDREQDDPTRTRDVQQLITNTLDLDG